MPLPRPRWRRPRPTWDPGGSIDTLVIRNDPGASGGGLEAEQYAAVHPYSANDDELRGMLVDDTPEGWVAIQYAARALGVARQTVLQRVKRGELRAVLTRTGRRKGLRIELP